MSTQGHTPGPWSATFGHPVTVWDSAGGLITDLSRSPRQSKRAANARLIAAAPDTLAALKRCEHHIVAMYHALGDNGLEMPPPDCQDTHRACGTGIQPEGACPEHEDGTVNHDCTCAYCRMGDAVTEIRAAIAKATGKA